MASNSQIDELIAKRNEIDEQIRELQREIDDEESCKIEDAIAKSKLWMDAYTAMYKFFTEHKEKGIKYVHISDNSSTAEKFEFDNDPNAPKPRTRKRK